MTTEHLCIATIDYTNATILVSTLDGSAKRSFECAVPKDCRFVRPEWNYDDDGEPINVRLVKV